MNKRMMAALLLALLATACSKTREEELQEQHSKGAELVEDKAAMAKGVGDALQKDGKAAAESVTAGVGNLVKGVAKGVDQVEASYKIELHDSAKGKQLKAERAVMIDKDVDGQKGIKAYIISPQALNGQLQLRALDEKGQEIGRSSKVAKTFEADDAAYVEFRFDPATPFSRIDRLVVYLSN
ncbi:hypothetical protein [Chitinilyticum piscinae]|nr:hypothetical protein [Chitinilyticum piscinae]